MALALDLGALSSRLSREGAQSGQLTASLIWNDPSDLDLHAHVRVKGKGQPVHIFYGNRKGAGGELDVDMNVELTGPKFSLEPVENVFWASAPGGHYKITVSNAGTNSSDTNWDGRYSDSSRPIPFKVFLNKDGDYEEFSGEWRQGMGEITCFEFDRDGPGTTGGGGNYLVFPPSGAKTTFKELCDQHGVTWKVGCGFYSVAKSETIQGGKEMLLHDTENNTFTVGSSDCREKLGWPAAGELKKGPKDILAGHRLYVQSTSYNRVIPADTHVLFEVDAETYAKHQKTTSVGGAGEAAPKAKAKAKAAAEPERPAPKAKAKAKAEPERPAPKAKGRAAPKPEPKAKGKAKAKAEPKSGSKRPAPAAKEKAKAKARR